jgi:hypothetical protein
MPTVSHQRAAELHELAAQAHRTASVHHGKEDHETGHELSKHALERMPIRLTRCRWKLIGNPGRQPTSKS